MSRMRELTLYSKILFSSAKNVVLIEREREREREKERERERKREREREREGGRVDHCSQSYVKIYDNMIQT